MLSNSVKGIYYPPCCPSQHPRTPWFPVSLTFNYSTVLTICLQYCSDLYFFSTPFATVILFSHLDYCSILPVDLPASRPIHQQPTTWATVLKYKTDSIPPLLFFFFFKSSKVPAHLSNFIFITLFIHKCIHQSIHPPICQQVFIECVLCFGCWLGDLAYSGEQTDPANGPVLVERSVQRDRLNTENSHADDAVIKYGKLEWDLFKKKKKVRSSWRICCYLGFSLTFSGDHLF